MKINELDESFNRVDELDWSKLGSRVRDMSNRAGQAVGAAAGGVAGAARSVAQGVGQGAKAGYNATYTPNQNPQQSTQPQQTAATTSQAPQQGSSPEQQIASPGQQEAPEQPPGDEEQPTSTTAQSSNDITSLNGQKLAQQLQQWWSTVKSNPANATSSFQVKNQILAMAKDVGLTGTTIKEHAAK